MIRFQYKKAVSLEEAFEFFIPKCRKSKDYGRRGRI